MSRKIKPIAVLTDSLLKDCEEPRDADVVVYRGATLKTLTKEVRSRKIDLSGTQLCIIHIGTNDVDNGDFDVIVPRYHELVSQIVRHNYIIKLVITSILPRPVDFEKTQWIIQQVNADLKRLCYFKSNLHFNHMHKSYMIGGRPNQLLYASDGLHLSYKGHIKATQILKNLVACWIQRRLTI